MAIGSVMSAGLTQRELSLFAAAFASLKDTDRNIDWEKFTQLAGYKSINSARVCFRPVVKKLDAYVKHDCPGDADDATRNAATTATGIPKAPRAKKTNYGTESLPKRRARPTKRKLDDETPFDEKPQPAAAYSQTKSHATSLGAVKPEPENFAGGASLASLPPVSESGPCLSFSPPNNGQSGGSQRLVHPAEPSQLIFNSGSADTYTGSSSAACDPTATLKPVNDGSTIFAAKGRYSADRLVGDKLKSNESIAASSLKSENAKSEEDGPTAQLIREATSKTEESGEQVPVVVTGILDLLGGESERFGSPGGDAKSILGGVASSVNTGATAPQDAGVSVPFQDQCFSYGDSLDFVFDELDGKEDII